MTRSLPHLDSLFDPHQVHRAQLGAHTLYSAVDLVRLYAETPDPADRWSDLKQWEPSLSQLTQIIKTAQPDGTWTELEMLPIEGALRLIQSINSPRAEKVKLWLAEAGRDRIEEEANPELAVLRTRKLYEQKGYNRDWIEKRVRGISARHELTAQWYRRGLHQSDDFRALSNALSHGIFGMDVAAYRQYKGLRAENLRDHMNEMELALLVLGESTAAMLHKSRDSQGPDQLRRDVQDAAQVAGQTRAAIEQQMGHSVVSAFNLRSPTGRKKGITLTPAEP